MVFQKKMPHKFIIKRARRFFIYRVLHVDDTPHRIALGVALGIFVTWTPTIGLQMGLVVLLAWLCRANKLVGLPFVWISNPATAGFIYYPNYLIGKWILGSDTHAPNFWSAMTFSGNIIEKIQTWWAETYKVFGPLWIGSLIVGLILGIISYALIYYTIIEYRKLRNYRRIKRQEKLKQKKLATKN